MKQISLPRTIEQLFFDLLDLTDEVYLVGGTVRDQLLSIPTKDYDFCIDADPPAVKQHLEARGYRFFNLGEKFGTVSVLGEYGAEITSFRKETGYSDHRFPTIERAYSLADDLRRRDFTINALCYHPRRGIIDMFDGLEDLRKGVIRCVGAPADRFEEDALRLLRAIRFACRFNFAIEERTWEAIKSKAPLLEHISKERIISELGGIFKAPGDLRLLITSRIASVIFPSVPSELLEVGIDLFKVTICEDPNYRIAQSIHYLLIADDTNELARNILKNLKVARKCLQWSDQLTWLRTQRHFDTPTIKRFLGKFGDNCDAALEYATVYFGRKGIDFDANNWQQVIATTIRERHPYLIEHLAIDGFALTRIGLSGVEIARAKEHLFERVLIDPGLNKKEILLELAKKL